MPETIRIKADLLADTTNLTLNINQSFDLIEVLSLTLSSSDLYRLFNSPYGVLVGRVTTNGGFGIPNAKVSVFIPITSEDQTSDFIKSIYPYTVPQDTNSDGVRYNLLPKDKQSVCHVPVGTFSEKTEMLDNEPYVEIYDKYYKYNSVTNNSGDYMIMGIPSGPHTIHMDVDLSDIGFVSVRPYDLIAQGYSPKQFDSNNKFRSSKDLDSLPHIQALNTTVDIIPFWGDNRTTYIGLTQLNFNLPVDITPNAVFFGAIFSDSGAGRITKKCRPRIKLGNNCDLSPVQGSIEMIRKVSDLNSDIEYFPINAEIDDKGNWVTLIPMNIQKVVTDEFGNFVSSANPNIGIPTKSSVRFRINPTYFSYKFFSGLSRTASFLIPNLYNRYEFGADTNADDFFDLHWKKIYTIRQYIPRLQKVTTDTTDNFVGIKRIGDCGDNYSIPYNRISSRFDPLYSVIFLIISVFTTIIKIINLIPLVKDIKLSCNDVELDPDAWRDCILNNIATFLKVVNYEFYNDWLTGSLYAPLMMYKTKFRNGVQKWEKYCDFDCREKGLSVPNDLNYVNHCHDTYVADDDSFLSPNSNPVRDVGRGLLLKFDSVLYYAARNDIEKNSTLSSADLSLGVDQTKNFFFATNIAELGSTVDCDIDNIPYLIKNLSNTSFHEEEEGDVLFNIDSLKPNNYNRNAIQLISQTQTDELAAFYDNSLSGSFQNLPEYDPNTNNKTQFVAFDRPNTEIRQYLCENQHFFNKSFVYTQSGVTDANSPSYVLDVNPDGSTELADFTYDDCKCNNQSLVPHLRTYPYYLYFGLGKGKNSYDRLIKEYFSDCN